MVGRTIQDPLVLGEERVDKTLAARRFVPDPNVLVDTALRACVALQPGLALDSACRGEHFSFRFYHGCIHAPVHRRREGKALIMLSQLHRHISKLLK